jgi:rSAM/selenodomain-associated transferase 2/rSAM/selenodomain-associated transferase 1
MTRLLVSVVVPVWRDHDSLGRLLGNSDLTGCELIVSVPLGESATYRDARGRFANVHLVEGPRGRAIQMNTGAAAATGRWLLFLHADSRLPAEWQAVFRQAELDPRVVGGAFRFALDSRDPRARILELGVRLRVQLLKMPYGDQGIFVRRDVFDRIGGFARLPLMEDVELMRRLPRAGALHFPSMPVVTSARRWERDGWLWRSLSNLMLASSYMLGASPSRLAQRYIGRSRCAVLVMARAPWAPGKTRIPARDEQAHTALREALLFDTLDAAGSVRRLDRLVACEPSDAVPRLQDALGGEWDVIGQRGASLGERMSHAFEDAFGLGYESVVMIGSDLPDLPARLVPEAFRALERHRDAVVLGPATDGGYYLVGVNRPQPALFDEIEWSTGRVLEQTLEVARRAGLRVTLLERWSDVDSEEDLRQLATRASAAGAAPRTRAWMERPP